MSKVIIMQNLKEKYQSVQLNRCAHRLETEYFLIACSTIAPATIVIAFIGCNSPLPFIGMQTYRDAV